jgi:hypothetical protein
MRIAKLGGLVAVAALLMAGVGALGSIGSKANAVLTVVTHIMSDGRVARQETAQSGMEECHRMAEIVNNANGADEYMFFASCREGQLGQQRNLAKGGPGIVGTAELQVEPNRTDYLLDSIRTYATEKEMVYSFGPRLVGNRTVNVGIWGGSAFLVGLSNPFRADRVVIVFSEFDEHENWQPYRDDFLMFLRRTFGPESVRDIQSPREFSR